MFKCYASEIRQAQKGNYPRIPLTCGMNRQIHKTESRLEFIGGWGVKEMRSYFLMVKEFLFGMMKKLWK